MGSFDQLASLCGNSPPIASVTVAPGLLQARQERSHERALMACAYSQATKLSWGHPLPRICPRKRAQTLAGPSSRSPVVCPTYLAWSADTVETATKLDFRERDPRTGRWCTSSTKCARARQLQFSSRRTATCTAQEPRGNHDAEAPRAGMGSTAAG
jgi:hypothetical protein